MQQLGRDEDRRAQEAHEHVDEHTQRRRWRGGDHAYGLAPDGWHVF